MCPSAFLSQLSVLANRAENDGTRLGERPLAD